MLLHSASQLLTIAGAPQRGHDLGQLGIIPDGAVLFREGKILSVGSTADLCNAYPDEETLDAKDNVVMPGFVDPHTHLLWVGDRAAEFEMRLEGKTYLEILAAGGGILSTVHLTRAASLEMLMDEARPRLREMLDSRHHHRRGQDRIRSADRNGAAHAAGTATPGCGRTVGYRPHLPGCPCHPSRI